MFPSPFTQQGTLFGKGSLPVVEQHMAFLEERHKLIAHNIANAETRFYKAKDLPANEFYNLLDKSIKARDERHVKVYEQFWNSNIFPGWHGGYNYRQPEQTDVIMNHAENTVDIDQEVAKQSRNQQMFRTMSRLAKKNYDLIRATIRETP